MDTREMPNILIFVMDTQPVRNMTPYGFPKDTTPNIQKIADEGVVYENHFETGTWTLPSHASLFTGKYQSGHGAGTSFTFVSRDIPTMAEVLGRAGYQTVAISANTSWVRQDEVDTGRGFEDFIDILPDRPEEDTFNEGDKGSTKALRAVKDWFDNGRNEEKPFLMFINCTEPHLRAWAAQPFRGRFLLEGASEEEARKVNQTPYEEYFGLVPDRPDGHMNGRDWAILKSLYDGETACLDHRMGLLFDYMEANKLLENTLLIITSDHGDLLDRKGYISHEPPALFDDLIHTPLIVRYPGVVPKGKRVKHLVQICDWLPTFVELLGIEDANVIREMQGVSLVPTWSDGPVRDFAVAEHQASLIEADWFLRHDLDYRPWLVRLKTIRTLEWKYIWYSDGNDMIFDLVSDPGERNNLIEGERSRASDMRLQLESFLLSIERRDYGDKLQGSYIPFVERLKAWGFFREPRFPT